MPKPKPSRTSIPELSKKYLEEAVPYDEPEINPYAEQAAKLEREIKELKESVDPELEKKIQKLIEYFGSHGLNYDKLLSEKKAYPNYDQYMFIPGRHDVKKWLFAVKDLSYKQKAGFDYKEAIRQATSGWPKMEIYDFLNWLRYYQEGTPMKYKFAQVWYENGQPGYFLHIKPDPAPAPEPVVDSNAVNEAREDADRREEKKRTIEKQRQKIIGRLDSAEKLLRSPEGQMFAGDELENLMEAIYNLKKKVQLVNKLSLSTRLYEDMIVREANILGSRGFVKAADLLYSVAQTPAAAAESAQGAGDPAALPPPAPPADPSGAGQSGTMSGLPSTVPGTPDIQTPVDGDQNKDQPPAGALVGPAPTGAATVSSPAIMPQGKPQAKGIKEFLENMDQGNKTDDAVADDELEVEDTIEVNEADDMLMVSEAQAVPPAPTVPPAALEDVPMTDAPPPERNPPAFIPTAVPEGDEKAAPTPAAPTAPEEPLEVTEDDLTPEPGAATAFSNKIDEVMSTVTIPDIVAELEDISKSYKTREQPRRLNKVDMMLDSVGLASMFPSLSEAQNKALEANNYISTRVDDILSKLRGAIASQETAPTNSKVESPEVAGIKGKLQADQEKEKQRKQMRKEQEAAALEGAATKETPQVEMGELGAPAAAPAGPAPRPLG